MLRRIYPNIFVAGSNLPNESEALSGLPPRALYLNARAGTVDIPGDGPAKVTLTTIQDVGSFVAASLDIESWDEESGMVGETTTWNEVVKVAERITGRSFLERNVREDSELIGDGGGIFKSPEDILYSQACPFLSMFEAIEAI